MKTHFLVVGALALAMLAVATGATVADDKSAPSGTLTENEMIFQSSRLGNLDVYSQRNSEKKLGNLDNLLINAHKGQLLPPLVSRWARKPETGEVYRAE